MRSTISSILGCAAGLTVLISVFDGVRAAESEAELRQETADLAWENELLKRQIELSSGQEFYLVVDPSLRRLRLLLQGVVLSEYEMQELTLGRPRSWFKTKSEPPGWGEQIWSGGALSPGRENERVEMFAPSADSTGNHAALSIPPTPEEAIRAPLGFKIVYNDGLAVEIASGTADRPGWKRILPGWGSWLRDRVRTMLRANHDNLRIRITMNPKDAASLYRSLPPDTKLVILRHSEE